MDTIGKFKTNFLGKNKSFKIGFNNRSPFSYITGTGVGQPSLLINKMTVGGTQL